MDNIWKTNTELMKKTFYKAKTPHDTIKNIRDILFKAGIFVTEFSDSHGDFYHSHVVLADEGLSHLSISTNGKGTTPAYSLASAYAEMMERLQNNFKLVGEKYATKHFLSSLPEKSEFRKRLEEDASVLEYELFFDEKHIALKELLAHQDTACSKIFGTKNSDYLRKHYDLTRELLCIPYYNVFKDQLEYLPAKNSITGSNGMCAGNTPEEALVQGLCEIFERYVIKKIFTEDIVLPQIDLEHFIGTDIYDRIINLQSEKNYQIIILDGSLGMGLPVIGTIIIDKANQKYRLEMGGATNPVIALTRCLTEHFQADSPIKHMNNINTKEKYQHRTEEETKYINMYHQMIDGDGELDIIQWLQQKPTNAFTGLITIEGDNHKEELIALKKILIKNDFELYVRDNSILGFPAYHIYVPGMSEVFDLLNEDDTAVNFELNNFHEKLYRLKSLSKQEVHKFCLLKDRIYTKARSTFRTIKGEFLYHTNSEIREIKPYLFLATSFFYAEDYPNATKYIDKFIEDERKNDNDADLTYYYCAKQFLELKQHKSTEEANRILNKLYDIEMVEEVTSDLSNPDDALQYYNLPNCFDCETCPIKPDCKYFDVMKVAKKIQVNSITDIDQMQLNTIFH